MNIFVLVVAASVAALFWIKNANRKNRTYVFFLAVQKARDCRTEREIREREDLFGANHQVFQKLLRAEIRWLKFASRLSPYPRQDGHMAEKLRELQKMRRVGNSTGRAQSGSL